MVSDNRFDNPLCVATDGPARGDSVHIITLLDAVAVVYFNLRAMPLLPAVKRHRMELDYG